MRNVTQKAAWTKAQSYMQSATKYPTCSRTGFTMIEMIVSLGVFSIALLISVSTILSVSAAQKKAVALQNAEDNFRFAFEAMAKEIRTGTQFFCADAAPGFSYAPEDCPQGERLLFFQNARGERINYELSDTRIKKTTNDVSSTFLTSPLVEVQDMRFYLAGARGLAEDKRQPRVTILLRGSAGAGEAERVTLRLQTTVSQRRLDN